MISAHDIRLARPADAPDIAALSREAIEHGLPWRWTPPRVLRCIRDASTNVVVLRRGGDLLGFAAMRYDDEDAHIVLFAVRAGWRRGGIGSALLAWLEATAAVAGIRRVRLEARAGNADAIAFYRRHGFEDAGARLGYYEGVEDALRLVKPLGTQAP